MIYQRTYDHKKVNDLAEIPILNDAELLKHLQVRYMDDEIYCFCGPSLLAINPYRRIDRLVNDEMINLIKGHLYQKTLSKCVPHVWTISA